MAVWLHINYNISKGKESKDLSKLVKYHYNVSTSVSCSKEGTHFLREKSEVIKKYEYPPILPISS